MNTLRQKLLSLALIGSTAACSGSYAFEVVSTGPALDSKGSALVTIPSDGRFGQQTYAGSGATTAKAVEAALAPRLARVEVTDAPISAPEALTRARARGARYLVVPEIVNWEDRATEWSGKPDHVAVDLTVRDVASDTVLHRVVIKGASSWWTFGGDHPAELLPRPINEYVRQIFEEPPKVSPRAESRKSTSADT